jgi:hypothetical protein
MGTQFSATEAAILLAGVAVVAAIGVAVFVGRRRPPPQEQEPESSELTQSAVTPQ